MKRVNVYQYFIKPIRSNPCFKLNRPRTRAEAVLPTRALEGGFAGPTRLGRREGFA